MKQLKYLLYAAACLMILASFNLLSLKHSLAAAQKLVYFYAGIQVLRLLYFLIYARERKKKKRKRKRHSR